MIKVKDNRSTNEMKLDKIAAGRYFMFNDVLLRRVVLYDGYSIGADDGIPVIEITRGVVTSMRRDAWVIPIRDEQIDVSVED